MTRTSEAALTLEPVQLSRANAYCEYGATMTSTRRARPDVGERRMHMFLSARIHMLLSAKNTHALVSKEYACFGQQRIDAHVFVCKE